MTKYSNPQEHLLDYTRKLDASYRAHGEEALKTMQTTELCMLLSLKQWELDQAKKSAPGGQVQQVDSPLKVQLEEDCRKIGGERMRRSGSGRGKSAPPTPPDGEGQKANRAQEADRER